MLNIFEARKEISNYKIQFKNKELINQNYSQASQDIFVLSCLDGKQNGTFLDLGCNKPDFINNTFLLETKFDWQGLSLDIDSSCISKFPSVRNTPAAVRDCTNLDWNEIASYFSSTSIDYLSLDLEPADRTLECLESIPFDRFNFSVITFEHDFYRFGNYYRKKSRETFTKFGYHLLCANVKNAGSIFEDWYVDPKKVDLEKLKPLETNEQEWIDILYI